MTTDSEETSSQSLLETIWKIPQQARERALSSNRKSDHNRQLACIYNMNYLLTEKEYSLSSSVDMMPSFIYKNLLSDRGLPMVLRARYLNLLLDDMDFERHLRDIQPESYDTLRENVNMENYCFQVRNHMINHVERYEKLCTIFHVPFQKDDDSLPVPISVKEMLRTSVAGGQGSGQASRKGSFRKLSFTAAGTFIIQNQNDENDVTASTNTVVKSEQDYDKAVQSVHNHQQYEDIIVNILLTRSQDLSTKMVRLRMTQLNLIFDRNEVRHAIENIEESRFENIVNRLTGGKEANHQGKVMKQPSKMIEGIKSPEDYFNEDRIRIFNKFQKIFTSQQ